MTKKKSVKKKGEKKWRSTKRDQYTVQLEDIYSQNRVVTELVTGLNDKFDAHLVDFENLRMSVENLRMSVENLRMDVENLRMDVENLKMDVENMKTDIEFVKGEISLIRHNLVTRDELKLLETRVARLERTRK
jgi:peptidoglycan hydrolase CwlO-like protein